MVTFPVKHFRSRTQIVSIFSCNTTTGFSFANFVRKIFYWQILCFISNWLFLRLLYPASYLAMNSLFIKNMSSCLLESLCLLSLRNSGAKYVGNKLMPGWFQNFSVSLSNTLAIKLLTTQQKPLCVMSAMSLAYLNILPRALIWFFNNSWDYLFHRRTHYPMLEKHGIKILAVCENQGKQHKLRVMKKSREGWCKKDRRLTDKQVSTKDFT